MERFTRNSSLGLIRDILVSPNLNHRETLVNATLEDIFSPRPLTVTLLDLEPNALDIPFAVIESGSGGMAVATFPVTYGNGKTFTVYGSHVRVNAGIFRSAAIPAGTTHRLAAFISIGEKQKTLPTTYSNPLPVVAGASGDMNVTPVISSTTPAIYPFVTAVKIHRILNQAFRVEWRNSVTGAILNCTIAAGQEMDWLQIPELADLLRVYNDGVANDTFTVLCAIA